MKLPGLHHVVQDKHATPAEIAAARIDIGAWLKSLPRRTRKIATTLATGEATGKTAKRFRVSSGRISQMRRELMESWEEFVSDGHTSESAVVTGKSRFAPTVERQFGPI